MSGSRKENHKENIEDLPIQDLIGRAQAGDEESLAEIIRRNKDWLRRKARYVQSAHERIGVDIDTLIADGSLGLYKALVNYDPSRGASLRTYADLYVQRAMADTIEFCNWRTRDGTRVQRSVYLTRGQADIDDACAMDGDSYSYAEVPVMETALSEGSVRNISEYTMPTEGLLDVAIFRKRVQDAISTLPPRERDYIVYRFYQSRMPRGEDVAEHFEISDREARRLQEHAYARLRKLLAPL